MAKAANRQSEPNMARDAAKALGVSDRAFEIFSAAGCPTGRQLAYCPFVKTLAEVGKVFGVSERTAAAWRAVGMPGEPGCFVPAEISHWLAGRDRCEPWHVTGNRALKPRDATGRLARALMRYYRRQIAEAADRARVAFVSKLGMIDTTSPELPQMLDMLFEHEMETEFGGVLFDDEAIENVMVECWAIV